MGALGDAWDAGAGVADDLAGSTDEAVARQLDNNEGGGVFDGTKDAVTTAGTGILDIPADAANTTLGACKGGNCGWFGEVDKHLDYRSLTGEKDPDNPDEWAEPTEANSGVDAALASLGQQGGAAGEDAADAASAATKAATPDWMNWLIEHPWITGIAVAAVALWISTSTGPAGVATSAVGD